MSLEEALATHEKQLDDLLKSMGWYVAALKAWEKACQVGHPGNREKAATQAKEWSNDLPGPISESASSWTFDMRIYLESAA